jgi:hypothetical protein
MLPVFFRLLASFDYLIKPFSVCPEVLSNINKIVTIKCIFSRWGECGKMLDE